jgi:UDP-N-acetylmuramoylalanine--D-glutamate ligase
MDASRFFNGKKITVMGLGLLGRGLGDTRYLARLGADVTVTDMKSADQLQSSLLALREFPGITFHLGGHSISDFHNRDFILKAAGVPDDSIFLIEARKNGIPIKMSSSWFVEIAGIPSVGVTGTRGKSTTTHLLYEIMKHAGMAVLLGGNVRGVSSLELLPEVTNSSIGLFELDSWQCQGFGESKLSPNVSVFTTFMSDHMNYYKGSMDAYFNDKAKIFTNQKSEDVLIVGEGVVDRIRTTYGNTIQSRVIVAKSAQFPMGWKLSIPGEHNIGNAMCAIEAARVLGVDEMVIREAVESFSGVPGRLQFLKERNGVKIYNDNNSTTPDATIAGLRAVGNLHHKNVVLIMGGDDKQLDMSGLIAEIPQWCSAVVLFKERGTDRVRDSIFKLADQGVRVYEIEGLKSVVDKAIDIAKPGETILYSPAFSSFGKYFANEFDRNDQFVALVDARTQTL